MTILQKYIFREWFATLVAVAIVLLIVLMGVFLGELLNDLADGRLPTGLLGLQIVLQLPEAFGNILPLSGFIAVMWGLGRLYRDQEMAVMRSNGFGWRQLLKPLMALMLPVAGILLINGFSVAPRAAEMADRKLEDAFKSAAIWGLQAGRFHVLQKGALVVYVEALEDDGRTLRNIFVQQVDGERERVWIAERGEYWVDVETDQRYLAMMNGQIADNIPGELQVRMLTFERNDLKLPEPDRKRSGVRSEARPTAELLALSDAESRAELQWRAAPAILLVVLGMLAIPLSHSAPREGRGSRVLLGILAYALYANILYLCRGWIAEGILPASVGMWWVHTIVFLIALLLLQRQGRMVGSG